MHGSNMGGNLLGYDQYGRCSNHRNQCSGAGQRKFNAWQILFRCEQNLRSCEPIYGDIVAHGILIVWPCPAAFLESWRYMTMRTTRMERIKQLNDGSVACLIADLKPHGERDLHRLLHGRQATNELRPLPETRIAARIRWSGKRRNADRREPVFNRAEHRWSKAGTNALLVAECRVENHRWADFLDWRACRGAAA